VVSLLLSLMVSGLLGSSVPFLKTIFFRSSEEGNTDQVCCFQPDDDVDELDCDSLGTFYKEEHASPGSYSFYIDIGISIFLVLFGGCMSGLTIGLLSLDPLNLEVLKKSGDEQSKKYANGIAPLIERHHLLLVTLLMANAVAMESLPIFLDKLVSPLIAIIVSVTAVLIFGEVVPQAICSRYGLSIGYYLRFFVWGIIFIFCIIAFPISIILDLIFDKNHGTYYRRAELKELVAIHGEGDEENPQSPTHSHSDGLNPIPRLNRDEVTIIKGALDMSHKDVKCAMTPISKAFMLSFDRVFDDETFREVLDAGHSRVPIYLSSKENVIGMILVKNLILLSPEDETPVTKLNVRKMPTVPEDLPLYAMLNIFQTGKSHMAIVLSSVDHMTIQGIITLEDVLEELIQEEIVDETDLFVSGILSVSTALTAKKRKSIMRQSSNPSILAPSIQDDDFNERTPILNKMEEKEEND